MHFLVFVPQFKAKAESIGELGLPDLVHGAMGVPIAAGPGDQAGTLFGWRQNDGQMQIAYDPSQQKWIPAAARNGMEPSRYWVGLWGDAPPTPSDLQRPYPHRSCSVSLGDNHEWWLPAEAKLPYIAKLADDGSWRFVPQRKFDEFCAVSAEWRQILRVTNPGPRIVVSELLEFVRLGLSINYRLTPEVESELELWTSSDVGSVAQAALKMLAAEEVFL